MNTKNENGDFYHLTWLQHIGFGGGDLAQNLIYQTISMYLLVGTYVDKHNPRLGKCRAWCWPCSSSRGTS